MISKEAFAFWAITESDLKFKIPCYVKNAFTICNVDAATVFQTLSQQDIEFVQKFIRIELYAVLESKSNERGLTYNDKYNSNFFGMFSSMREKFQFMVGDLKKLDATIDYVQKILREYTIDYFDSSNKKIRKMMNSWQDMLCETPAGLFYSDEHVVIRSQLTRDLHSLKQNLLARSKIMFNSFKDQFPDMDSLRDITEKSVNVIIEDDGKCRGAVNCVFCHEDEPTIDVKVTYQMTDKSGSWILSNLSKHINKHHILTERKPIRKRNNKKPRFADENALISHNKNQSNTKNIQQLQNRIRSNIISIDSSDFNAFVDFPAHENNNKYNHSQPLQKEATLLSLKIEPVYGQAERYANSNSITNVEHEELEDFFYMQLSTQIIQMTNATISNKEKVFSFTIRLNFFENISTEEIKCCLINGDGDCLFGSIAHQLFQNKLNSKQHKDLTRDLRKSTVEFIERHIHKYIHCLKGRIYEENEKKGLVAQNYANDSILRNECLNFVRIHLSKAGFWGGAESLRALSEIYKLNILIINDDGTCNMVQHLNKSHNRSITLVFRGNNHYDSVVGMCGQTILNFTKSVVQSQQNLKPKETEKTIILE